MRILEKLTYLIVIFALALPVAASANTMVMSQNDSYTVMDHDMSSDSTYPSHENEDLDNDMANMANMDCSDCTNDCVNICAGTILSKIQAMPTYGKGNVSYVLFTKMLKSITPDTLKHPPIFLS